jgi:hypothetical protein
VRKEPDAAKTRRLSGARLLEIARAGFELLAVRQDYFLKAHGCGAILVAVADDGYLIARFERVLRPSVTRETVWTGPFGPPFLDVAVVVGDGERNGRVWIDPIELRDSGFERGVVPAVVHGHGVVAKRRAGDHQASDEYREERNDPGFHRDTS